MKLKKLALFATFSVTTTFSAATSALASPVVHVTFKNLGSQDAIYKVVSINEANTHTYASPKPTTIVKSQEIDRYKVLYPITPDANSANVRYVMGDKICTFSTSFINKIIGGIWRPDGPAKAPEWSKNARSTGGATCNATIISRNFSDHSWVVEFTMK